MEELTIDDNYKTYTELINRLEDVKNAIKKQNYGIAMDILCKPYPQFQVIIHSELKESEDGWIKKEIINYLKEKGDFRSCWIAWLEKQGEHDMGISEATKQKLEDNLNKALEKETPESLNEFLEKQGEQKQDPCKNCEHVRLNCHNFPCITKRAFEQGKSALEVHQEDVDNANKVEPKFNLYDWVVTDKGDTVQIGAVNNGYYTIDNGMDFNMPYVDRCWHKWTIQDAKDGDILAYDNGCVVIILLFKKWFDEVGKGAYSYAHITTSGRHIHTNDWSDCGLSAHLATKEQRDTLVKAMADAGYTFDFEKKELKKIEQKPAWSEEDEEIHRRCICAMRASACGFPEEEKFVEQVDNWLNSLKERYTWKPSDEQMDAVKDAIDYLGGNTKIVRKYLMSLYKDLKELRVE